MDNGYPFTTEPNSLMEMIPPPNILNRVKGELTGSSSMKNVLPDGSLSNTPWRKAGVKYTTNEIYLDIIEEIDATVEPYAFLSFSLLLSIYIFFFLSFGYEVMG